MENAYFKYANTISPLTISGTNTALQDLDAVLFNMTQFYIGVIGLHCMSRWNIEINKIGRTDLTNKIVNEVVPYDPLPFATDNQFRFPLLAVYRTNEEYEYRTAIKDHIVSHFNLLYILPPLASDQAESLYPFLTHINRVLVNRTKEGSDSAFNSQEQVWVEAGLEQIGIERCEYGKIPTLKSNMYLPTISLTIKCQEILDPSLVKDLNFEELEGTDIKIKIHPLDGSCDYVMETLRT